MEKENYTFSDLLEIMNILRGKDGCPWDMEQTHESIRNNLTEETFEVVEAIDNKDKASLKEELGDLLLQVVFHAKISEDSDGFNINDVCDGICRKLIVRHPHIFADTTAKNSETVLSNWENIKKTEKGLTNKNDYLNAIPNTLPALHRAEKIQKRIIKSDNITVDKADLKGRIYNALNNISGIGEDELSHGIGELLYLIVLFSAQNNINSEESLYKYNRERIENGNLY